MKNILIEILHILYDEERWQHYLFNTFFVTYFFIRWNQCGYI